MGDDDLGSTPSSSAVRSASEVQGGGMTLKECQDIIQKSFSDPKVRVLMDNLEKSGCAIGSNFIRAVNCKGSHYAGGFIRGKGIIICGNHLQFRDDVVQAVLHELIHAYDDCRAANLDWHNCAHRACSEIRANHLSGDCHFKRELLRGHIRYVNSKLKGHQQVCVKRRAMQSLTSYDSPAAAKLALEAVWNTCYNDTAPFDRAP